METTKQQIIDIISNVLYGDYRNADKILPEDCLCSRYGANSMDKVDIVMQIEAHFDISLPDDELEIYMKHNGTIQNLIDVVNKYIE